MNKKDTNELDEIREFYDSVYYKSIKSKTVSKKHLRRLAKKLNIHSEQQVLDVACGVGDWLKVCKERDAKISGVDISNKAISFCKQIFSEGTFVATPAEKLPFESNQFDVISCLGSLEHFVDPITALKEMYRVAKKDAIFLLLVPNADFLTRRIGLFTGTYQIDAKEHVRTLQEWKTLFEKADIKVIKRWKDLHVLSWDWICSRKWYNVPARTLQALLLTIWPLKWQYQVNHLCIKNKQP